MRIICDSCGKKYVISDDKVRGKLFKIRCKKCSHVIVVHGTQEAAASVESATTKVYDYGPGESAAADSGIEWFYVKDGEQAGPATAVEVEQHYAAGVIEDETYIWREGMNDWLRFREVPEFGHVAPRQPVELPDEANEGNAFKDGMAGVTFSSEEPAAGEKTTPAVARGNGHADLGGFEGDSLDYSEDEATQVVALETFSAPKPVSAPVQAAPLATIEGTPSAALFSDADETNPTHTPAAMVADQAPSFGGAGLGAAVEPPAAAPAAEPAFSFDALAQQPAEASQSPRVSEDDLIGRRSENSVLFSLDLLSGSNEAVDVQPTEGSGLIDIRALAASEAGPNRPATQSGEAAVVAPAVMPMGRRRSNTGLYVILGVVCVVIVGLISAILILVMGKDDEIEVADPTGNVVVPADDDNQVAANVGEPDTGEPAVDPEAVARHERNATMVGTRKAMATQAEAQGAAERIANRPVVVAEVDRDATREREAETTREPERTERSETTAEERAERQARRERRARERAEAAEREDDGEDPVAAALSRIRPNESDDDDDDDDERSNSRDDDDDDDDDSGNETASNTPPPTSNIPESLSQSEVSRAIRRYRRRISQCTAELPSGESMRVDVSMTVQGTGRVASARTDTTGAVAQCVVAIVRDMSFPEFSGAPMTFTYPFRLRN